MASQVFSGTSNFSYTNNTTENVRIVINYMRGSDTPRTVEFRRFTDRVVTTTPTGSTSTATKVIVPPAGELVSNTIGSGITLTWAGVSVSAPNIQAIGRNLAFYVGAGAGLFREWSGLSVSSSNCSTYESRASQQANESLPTEIMLAPDQSFSAICSIYNIVVIPENG